MLRNAIFSIFRTPLPVTDPPPIHLRKAPPPRLPFI